MKPLLLKFLVKSLTLPALAYLCISSIAAASDDSFITDLSVTQTYVPGSRSINTLATESSITIDGLVYVSAPSDSTTPQLEAYNAEDYIDIGYDTHFTSDPGLQNNSEDTLGTILPQIFRGGVVSLIAPEVNINGAITFDLNTTLFVYGGGGAVNLNINDAILGLNEPQMNDYDWLMENNRFALLLYHADTTNVTGQFDLSLFGDLGDPNMGWWSLEEETAYSLSGDEFVVVYAKWNESTAAIPEPSTITLGVLSLFGLLVRRHRSL